MQRHFQHHLDHQISCPGDEHYSGAPHKDAPCPFPQEPQTKTDRRKDSNTWNENQGSDVVELSCCVWGNGPLARTSAICRNGHEVLEQSGTRWRLWASECHHHKQQEERRPRQVEQSEESDAEWPVHFADSGCLIVAHSRLPTASCLLPTAFLRPGGLDVLEYLVQK